MVEYYCPVCFKLKQADDYKQGPCETCKHTPAGKSLVELIAKVYGTDTAKVGKKRRSEPASYI
jgi:hypothetical protein